MELEKRNFSLGENMEEKPIKEEGPYEYLPPSRGSKIATVLLTIGLCGVLAYAVMEHRSVNQLAASRSQLSAMLNQEQGQIQTLMQKLNAAEAAPAPSAAAPAAATQVAAAPATEAAPAPVVSTTEQAPVAKPAHLQHRLQKHKAVAKAYRPEDPRYKQLQSQLTRQQQAIDEHQREIQETRDSVAQTRNDLQSTRDDLNGSITKSHDELSGSIAKTHEELVALERKGERSYFEFNLSKSKQFQKDGPMSISLRKSNEKHKYCDLVMIVNDSEVSKKHVNLYEPVLFYPEGYSQPLQLVINSIGKDAARGYVSEPKYKSSELASSASPAGGMGHGQPSGSTPAGAATLTRRPDAQ